MSAPDLRLVLLGAGGFVGSALLRQLHGSDWRAHLLVHRTPPASLPAGSREFRGSVTDLPDGLLPDEPHVVIHCASHQIDTDGQGFGINRQGVEQLCSRVNPYTRAVLFVSSASVYGNSATQPTRETEPLRPDTALARSRAECEMRLRDLAVDGRCRVETFRPRFVLGLGDQHVLPGLARLTQRGLTLGRGDQRFAIIDVDDFARILLARARAALDAPPNADFAAYNVGYERSISLHEMQELLCEHLALGNPRHHIPTPAAGLRALAQVPLPALQRQVQRLSLLGLSHELAVSRLAQQLPAPWLGRDPRTVVRRATQWLPQTKPELRWTH